MSTIKQYNKKAFLLPDSIKSMAAYHAKIMPDGEYMFRLHDCLGGVRLLGNVMEPAEVRDAVAKLRCLASAATEFADFIEENCSTIARLQRGEQFTSPHFAGTFTPCLIKGDFLKVAIKKDGSEWVERWELQIVVWGFENGEYKWLNS